MKKRNKLLYVGLWVLLLCWLLGSNKLMSVLSGKAQPKGFANFDEIKNDESNQSVTYHFDAMSVRGTLDESFGILGWAFVDADGETPRRYISIILVGEKKNYEIRIDEPQYRKDVQIAHGSSRIPDPHVGIKLDVTTLGMENGTYDLYIYCWENDDIHGLTGTGYQFIKQNADIAFRPSLSNRLTDDMTVTEQIQSVCSVDRITLKENCLNVRGWTFAPDMDAQTQNVYISLESEEGNTLMYTTRSMSRPDVVKAYKNELYENSGYTASIPVEEISGGIWELRLLTENGGKVWSSSPAIFEYNGKSVIYPWASSKVEDRTITEQVQSACAVDSITLKKNRLNIQGWTFAPDMDAQTQNVYISLESEEGNTLMYTTRSMNRPDVGQAFQSEQYENSGYTASIPVEEISDGIWKLRLLTENGGKVWASSPVSFIKSSDSVERNS